MNNESSATPGAEPPFVITVMGDFQNAPDNLSTPPAERSPIDVDRDNFDQVMGRLRPTWRGELGNLPQDHGRVEIELNFCRLEDFDPDRLIDNAEPLRALAALRQALNDPARFEAVTEQVSAWLGTPTAAGATSPVSDDGPATLLEQLLRQRGPGDDRRRPAQPPRDLQLLLHQLVAPHLIKIDTARQGELVAALDRELSGQLRAVLHDPDFQRLEAAWRGLRFLVDSVEGEAGLKVRLLQFSKSELQADLGAAPDDLDATALGRLLLQPAATPGGDAAALLAGVYSFGRTAEDIQLLENLGAVGQRLAAIFVGAVDPQLLDCSSFAELPDAHHLGRAFQQADYRGWNALRATPQARHLALALPPFLLRLPYGPDTVAAESFRFVEQADAGDHGGLLWCNPVFAVAAVVATAFAAEGWSLNPARRVPQLEGLPLYVYRDQGTAVSKPCTEALLNERLLGLLEDNGLLPLVAYRDTDKVTLPCLQTVAQPRSPLGWNRAVG